MAKLTPKQEKFCLAYLETGNASEAYRQSYSTEKMKPESVNNLAFRLLQHVEIGSRLAELKKAAADKAVMTLESHLADLKMLRNAAAKDRKWSAAVAAEVARGKHSGVAVEKSQAEVTVKRSTEDLTDDELAQEAARHGLKL
jgi:phage terminase small subunit